MIYDQVLKTHTREVLYEKYRTEKLLARRATRKIGEEQAKKLLEGVFPLYLLTTCSALSPHSDLGL
jgi:septin family protein